MAKKMLQQSQSQQIRRNKIANTSANSSQQKHYEKEWNKLFKDVVAVCVEMGIPLD